MTAEKRQKHRRDYALQIARRIADTDGFSMSVKRYSLRFYINRAERHAKLSWTQKARFIGTLGSEMAREVGITEEEGS